MAISTKSAAPNAKNVSKPKQPKSMKTEKQLTNETGQCPKGHDIRFFGRERSGRCKECARIYRTGGFDPQHRETNREVRREIERLRSAERRKDLAYVEVKRQWAQNQPPRYR